MRVFVLLFNSGTENEGIHTIQMGDVNKVLMFESEDDATRYALLLEAQDFPNPNVEALDSEEIEEFCKDAGYEIEFIKEGMLAIPPESNLDDFDWQDTPSKSSDESSELDRIRRRLEGLL